MNGIKTLAPLALMLYLLTVGCQSQSTTPTVRAFVEVLVEGTSIRFLREHPVTRPDRDYMDGDNRGVLTLQDNCLRLGEDGPVVIWPDDFTPYVNDGVVEVHNADGQVVARVGDPVTLWGGQVQRDAGDCPGPVWTDTRIPVR